MAFLLVFVAFILDLTTGQKIEEQLEEAAKDDDNEVEMFLRS